MFPSVNPKLSGFSSKNKIQQHHGDGTQTIICMGRPFRVERRLTSTNLGYGRRSRSKKRNEGNSFVYLVENSSRLSEFPTYLVLKRIFFNVDQITEAHKEIGILSNIKDKNIIRVYHNEIVRSEGKISVTIAMEYCDNNLARRIASGGGSGAGTRLSEAEICHILFAITSALGYLHSLQPPIAHRNITPENILINNNLTGPMAYMLTNFEGASTEAYLCANREEAAMAIEDIERHTNPAFRAPEMADPWGKRRICEKADLWMLGVLLYYLMYLRLPFEATNMALSRDPKPHFPVSAAVSGYTGSLRTILAHLLEPDPEARWDVFALTNFLRFDEDVNRHLGSFCFTRTEFPEGWEEQEVRVIGRDVPAKAPPMSYAEAGHPTAAEPRHAQTAEVGEIPPASSLDEAVREVWMVTGDGPAADLTGAEAAEYRRMIIREQEEAWARATAARAELDDLFVGPQAPQRTARGGETETETTTEPRQARAGPVAAAQPDPFGSDGIFSAPPPASAAEALFAPPQPIWGSGRSLAQPGGGFGRYDAEGPPAQPPAGLPPHVQPPGGGVGDDFASWGPPEGFPTDRGGGESYPTNPPPPPQSAAPLMPQMHMDFLSPPPNQYQPPQSTETVSSQPNNAPPKGKKDPFSDLLL